MNTLVMNYSSAMTSSANLTRESYLAWVKEWKATYKALTETIRTTRKEIKASPSGSEEQKRLQARKRILRNEATRMLSERHEMKEASMKARDTARAA